MIATVTCRLDDMFIIVILNETRQHVNLIKTKQHVVDNLIETRQGVDNLIETGQLVHHCKS